MSWENLKDAYRTRLGNLTAKSVLVLIVDEANAEGLAFVGLDRVATLTEINKRTTLRMIQVFGAIDLVNRTEATLKGKLMPAFQVNLTRLGLEECRSLRFPKCSLPLLPRGSGSIWLLSSLRPIGIPVERVAATQVMVS